jgi:segregation and condensation protein B
MPQPIDVVEALLFASDAPLETERIREVLDLADAASARALVEELRARYAAAERALTVVEVGGGFRMVTRPELAPWLLRLAKTRTRARLSRPALETLAIVAYRQPVSRPEVDTLRGVNSEGVLDNLLERRLLRIAGRKEAPGRPFLYETTREFLVAFGLRDVGDLPKVEGELPLPEVLPEAVVLEAAAPEVAVALTDGQAQTEQDPGPGGADVAPRR